MSTAAPLELDSLEEARRLSGLKFTQIADLTGIPYKRLWRYFRDDGSLTRLETERLRGVLLKSEAPS